MSLLFIIDSKIVMFGQKYFIGHGTIVVFFLIGSFSFFFFFKQDSQPAGSPRWGLNSQPQDQDLSQDQESDAQPTEPPGAHLIDS